jgi:hypothetical protein
MLQVSRRGKSLYGTVPNQGQVASLQTESNLTLMCFYLRFRKNISYVKVVAM